jgi:DNA-binding NtrC family response regulator
MPEKPNILIIDDDEDILKTTTTLLSRKGYQTDTAKTGVDTIKKSKEKFFNLALIDIVLPDMKGAQLLTKLKPTTPKTRKIIITGHASLDNAVEALNLGADAYIMKPIDPAKLLQTIEEQLRKQQEDMTLTQEKMVEYIETRAKQLEQEKTKPTKK